MKDTKNNEIMLLLQEHKKPLVPRTEDEMAKLLDYSLQKLGIDPPKR